MSYRLIIPREIEQEIAEAFDSFENMDRALSFIGELNVIFERIAERPFQFPVIYSEMRRGLLSHHEYSVFFEVDVERAQAAIHAVLHQRRDPALWPR